MGGFSPCEDALEAVLEDEDYPNSARTISKYRRLFAKEAYLALKRRKLLVIRGSEKLGLLMYFEDLTSGAKSSSSTSSSGITCCRSLRRRRLARHFLRGMRGFVIDIAHLVKRRSCRE